MTHSNQSISPLRQRMIEDMTVLGFTPCTQRGYIAAVKNFTAFFGRSPDQAGAEDLRRFQLHLRSEGASATTRNAAVSALRFLFGVTLDRGDAQIGMTTVRQPIREMAAAAIDELVAIAHGADPQARIIELPTTLVVRGSTGTSGAGPETLSRESPRDRPRRESV